MAAWKIPRAWRTRGVQGISVGGCIDPSGRRHFTTYEVAHAHNNGNRDTDSAFGWICFRDARDVLDADGQPTNHPLHEYAHILNPGRGHDRRWAATCRTLGLLTIDYGNGRWREVGYDVRATS